MSAASWSSVTTRRRAAWQASSSRSVLRPQAGHLIFFDGRDRPHYVRALKADNDVRVVAVMNYYTDECPEWTRPELNRFLYCDQP